MSNLRHPKNPEWSFSRKKVVKWILDGKCILAKHEIDYLSYRFPATNFGDDLKEAIMWAKKFGHRDIMAEVVAESGSPSDKSFFAYIMKKYKGLMKNSIDSAKGAYVWANNFPEDREEMRPKVQADEWAVRWAEDIGDEDLMKSRIDMKFYKRMFEKRVEEKSGVSFASGR